MAIESPVAKQQFFDANGNPLVGGKLYIYEAGTTTPATTWTDKLQTAANANPIILDSRGECVIWLDTESAYKYVLKTALDVEVYSVDNVNGALAIDNLRTDLAADDGSSLIGYIAEGTGAVAATVQDKLRESVSVEDFGADPTGVSDSYDAIQAALDYAIPRSLHVVGTGKYKSSERILIPSYRTTPAVSLDFVVMNFTINQLTYTKSTGTAIQVDSPAATVYVKKLIGPGGSTATSGLTITGQGDPQHRVDYVTGFGININLLNAYSHTVWVGYCQDAEVGVLMTNSNHIKVYAGRIGGQFSFGTTAIDPSTCSIGVKIVGGVANEIHATIEYCKRTANSVGLWDDGTGTFYRGYAESSNLWNIYAIGNGGRYYSVSGTNHQPSGVYLENDNQWFNTAQNTLVEVTPAGNNTTLTFDTPGTFQTANFAKITGPQGYTEQQITTYTPTRNEIIYSAKLNDASWTQSVIGNANWGAVTIDTSQPGFLEANYIRSTKFTFPGLPAEDDIYRVGQSSKQLYFGPVNYGIWARVESGNIDVQVRLLDSPNNVQSKQVVNLAASNKWVNIAARFTKQTANSTCLYELQFRTKTGAVIQIANTYLLNGTADTFFAPWNEYDVIKDNIKGIPVNGNSFELGVKINGVLQNQISPPISAGGLYVLSRGDYPVYAVTGGWTGNLFLEGSIYDGQRVIIKRDGVAATGVMQLIPTSTIDGTATPINIAPAYTVLEVIWSTTAGGWLRLN